MWIRTKIVYFLLNKSNRLLAFSSKTDTRKSNLLSTIIRVIIPRKIGQPLTRISIASMLKATRRMFAHCVEQAQGLLLTQAQAPLEAMSVADSLRFFKEQLKARVHRQHARKRLVTRPDGALLRSRRHKAHGHDFHALGVEEVAVGHGGGRRVVNVSDFKLRADFRLGGRAHSVGRDRDDGHGCRWLNVAREKVVLNAADKD